MAEGRHRRFLALLIGIDRYAANPWCGDLYGAAADVVAMSSYLSSIGVAGEDIQILVSPQGTGSDEDLSAATPTRGKILEAIRQLSRRAAASDAGALIHFSGHGGRARTWFPSLKGSGGHDEGLVPFDVAESGLIRDVELTWLLSRMVRQGTPVTVLLDCCHSGGMVRSSLGGLRRRSARTVIQAPDAGNPVAALDDLAREWRRVHHRLTDQGAAARAVRHSRSYGGWVSSGLLQGQGVVMLSACRSMEFAFERDFGDGPRGALTHHLLEILDHGGRAHSWETIYQRLVGTLLRLSPPQRPLLEGDVGALGAGLLETTAASIEMPSDSSASRVVGQCLEPRRIVLPESEPEPLPGRVLRNGRSRCSQLGRLRQELARFAEAPLTIDTADGELSPHLWVGGRGEILEVLWADGRRVPGTGRLRGRDPRAVRRFARQLRHLALFLALRDFEGASDDSLAGVLDLEVGLLPRDYRRGDESLAEPLEGLGCCPSVEAGRWLGVDLGNRGVRPLHPTVLDLRPDWSVEILYPRRGVETLERGQRLRLPIETFLPPGGAPGIETLLVLATLEPESFEGLRLPALEEEDWGGPSRTAPLRQSDILEKSLGLPSILRRTDHRTSRRSVRRSNRASMPAWTSVRLDYEIRGLVD